MPPPKPFPARVHGLLAASSPAAVLLRRGPSRRVCAVGWDRETDRFTVGDWLARRVYERRCDLSPDGRWLVYFASVGGRSSGIEGPYTAVSEAPSLEPRTLWPKGDHWLGGGLFTDAGELWLNGCHDEPLRLQPGLRLRAEPPVAGRYGGECPSVYYRRLQRDGWRLTANEPSLATFEKAVGAGWVLRKFAFAEITREQGHGPYFDEHQLVRTTGGAVVDLPGWEWVEHDPARDRLVFARAGVLWATILDERGPAAPTPLFDFNTLRPGPTVAP